MKKILGDQVVLVVTVVCLLFVVFMFGRGCSTNDEVDRALEESREQIEDIQAEKDSLEALRLRGADSLAVIGARLERSDEARRRAEKKSEAAIAAIKHLPTYENLTHDDLAIRADSLFRAFTDR